jgi:putrescine transport system permease protein
MKFNLKSLILFLGLSFLYLPIIILIIYSFNENKRVMVWKGFSFKWYEKLFYNEKIIDSFYISIEIALISATISTFLGVMIGYTLIRIKKIPLKSFYIFISSAPLVMPELILGLSMLFFFIFLNNLIGIPSARGQITIIISHITFSIAFVAVIIQARLSDFNKEVEDAAMDLGMNPIKVIYKITLPIIAPSIISGWLLAFIISLDDLVVASFTSGPGANTLPIVVFSKVRLGLSPEVNALSAILIIFLFIVCFLYFFIQKKFLNIQK